MRGKENFMGEYREMEQMREATAEERKGVEEYILSISKPTGVNFFDHIENYEGEEDDKQDVEWH